MRVQEILEILETLTEQGFIEYIEPQESEIELLQYLFNLDIVYRPKVMGGSFGAVLKDEWKAEALKTS